MTRRPPIEIANEALAKNARRLARIEDAQKREGEAAEGSKRRRNRNHRLIQLGAVIDHYRPGINAKDSDLIVRLGITLDRLFPKKPTDLETRLKIVFEFIKKNQTEYDRFKAEYLASLALEKLAAKKAQKNGDISSSRGDD